MPTAPIRRLVRDDAEAFRELRLEALRLYPDAFGATFEHEREQSMRWFADRLEGGFLVGAGPEGRLDGMAGVYLPNERKARHKAVLWSMYVRPEARGTGLAQALIQACIDHARGTAEEIVLGVGAHNAPAIARYRSMGFEECGFERRALKTGGRYYDEILMAVRFV